VVQPYESDYLDFSMTDEFKCDYSKIVIPNDTSYIGAACSYVEKIAEKFGFYEDERDRICKALAEAVRSVIERGFEQGDERPPLEISCERVPLGVKIVIWDQGVPFDVTPLIADDACRVDGDSVLTGLCLMKEYMDQVEFHNRGKDGREIVLVKYTRNSSMEDYYSACALEPDSPPVPKRPEASIPSISIAPMKPDQAIEVCKTLYHAYGYSYFYPHMYYPERIVELNQSGHLFSAVALTDEGEVAGHGALMKNDPQDRIAELGIGAVKPAYRSQGVLSRISEFLTSKAKADGLLGIFGQAVTNHTFSQQVGLRMGFKDTAILLAYVPITSSFKQITDKLTQRDSMVVHYRYLNKPSQNTVYLPHHHKDILEEIYSELGANLPNGPAECAPQELPDNEAIVRTVITNVMGLAKIHVTHYGRNVLAEVKTRLKDLCMKRFEIIYLYLDLSDPLSCLSTEDFEKLGFFFAGLLPGGAEKGDALILQYLNNVPIDYSKLHIKSEFGSRLLDYVMQHDPNR
jgi:anti-sigma regulatory factor (Ser/Thr protein kinase)/GNAT superfamily N-acetyltransferase